MEKFLKQHEARELIDKLEPRLLEYPNDWTILQNVAAGYSAIGDLDKAICLMSKARGLTPHGIVARHLGLLYLECGEFDKAYELISAAYTENPEIPTIVWAYSEELLRRGEYAQGWKLHEESRPFHPGINKQELKLPEWHGEPLDGKHIVLIPEGGFGDAVMLLRFAPKLREMGATVGLIIWKTYELFSGQPGIDRVYREGDLIDLSKADYWVSTFSLPYLLGCNSIADIPWNGPYITPPSTYEWHPVTPKVGLVWSAGEYDTSRKYRSLTREQATQLVRQHPNLHWVNLQYGEDSLDPLMFSPVINDWRDTATLISSLDLLVTVDTGAMHLSGAMNIPTWTILGNGSDHRFFLPSVTGDKNPWYPSMTLFRNGVGRGFSTSLKNVSSALSELLVTASA